MSPRSKARPPFLNCVSRPRIWASSLAVGVVSPRKSAPSSNPSPSAAKPEGVGRNRRLTQVGKAFPFRDFFCYLGVSKPIYWIICPFLSRICRMAHKLSYHNKVLFERWVHGMTKTERTIYALVGPTRYNTLPFSLAIDLAMELLFVQNIAMDDIRVTRDIYTPVAKQLGKNTAAVSRQIVGLCNLCWDAMLSGRGGAVSPKADPRPARAERDDFLSGVSGALRQALLSRRAACADAAVLRIWMRCGNWFWNRSPLFHQYHKVSSAILRKLTRRLLTSCI